MAPTTQWTSEPTTPGLYWWRETPTSRPEAWYVHPRRIWWLEATQASSALMRHVDRMGGEWCGPIIPPSGESS